MIEIPPTFAGRPPVNPDGCRENALLAVGWRGAAGLAEDIRFYGQWMKDEAETRLGRLYPKIAVTPEMVEARGDLEPYVGRSLTVIAWLWARTVRSPNPAFAHVAVPLASTFMLSSKAGKEAYVEPVVEADGYRFSVKVGKPPDVAAAKAGTKQGRGATFRCLMSETPVPGAYIKAEGKAGRIGRRLMAVVAEGRRSRVYLDPSPEHERVAAQARPAWAPEGDVPARMTGGTCVPYGLEHWSDLFTPRELVALTTLSDLVQEARGRVRRDAMACGMPDDGKPLRDGGTLATAYADAVAIYLSLALSRTTNTVNALAVWSQSREQSVNLFSRQAIPMAWDFPEVNPFGGAAGDFAATTASLARTVRSASDRPGWVHQADARTQSLSRSKVVSTDPPYYDNVAYADLSDFFYVWLRGSLRSVLPDLFTTIAAPKVEELVATAHRHGGKEKAEAFFLQGMTEAMRRLAERTHPAFPVTIYYAFKQSERRGRTGPASTGWETFLDAVIRAGFALTGTWPMRTERPTGVKTGTNVLASSIVLVCRPRPSDAPVVGRRDFLARLEAELPRALACLQASNIAPVDLAQAAIGPGMAVYTRYARVLESDGSPLTVRTALALINEVLDEVLAEQEGDLDAESRWAVAWFEQCGFGEGDFGVAETLAKAKNTSVQGLVDAGVLACKGGKARLRPPGELPGDRDPGPDVRLTVWEMVHHLIRVLEAEGESAAARLAAKLGSRAGAARELAYRLYTGCERNKRAREALSYDALVRCWPEIMRLARDREP